MMLMPFEPFMLLAGTEVTGIAGLAGVVVVSQAYIVSKMLESMRARDQVHAEERQADRAILDRQLVASHAAVDALSKALEVLAR